MSIDYLGQNIMAWNDDVYEIKINRTELNDNLINGSLREQNEKVF